jgi:hypothetical protein
MRYLVLLALVSCADTSKLEARVHDLEKRVSELQASCTAAPVHGNIDTIRSGAVDPKNCIDISFPAETQFPEAVAFDVGRTTLRGNDKITIREVLGTRKDFAKDGIYLVRGDYTLTSADEAVLGLNVTGGCTSHTERGHVPIKKGSGKFELAVKAGYVGQPHVTFYVNGEGSGGVYFGKGDFLLK